LLAATLFAGDGLHIGHAILPKKVVRFSS